MLKEAVQPEIHELIEQKKFAMLKTVLAEMEIHDLAALLEELEDEDLAVCFRLLPQDRAADVLAEFEVDVQERLLETLSSERVAHLLREMAPDDRTELLEELPGQIAQRLLNYLRGDDLQTARSLLAYPEDSIGRLMTPEYIAARPGWTVQRTLEHIRKVAPTKETMYVIYVVDDSWRLLDEVRLEEVVLSASDTTIEELMDNQVAALRAEDDQEDAIELFKKYDAVALPVVNNQGVLVGIITHDDVLDVAEEEDTEDMHRLAGLEPIDTSYFATGFAPMLRKRLPWLVLLLGCQMFTTVALMSFNAVPLFAVLVLFMPLINSPAGNTGSQVAGLMIRALAVQEVEPGDWLRVLGRELARGLAMGAFLAVVGFAAAAGFARLLDTQGRDPYAIASAVSFAILAAVTLGNLLGAMLPFFFKKVGLDPAVTSGPFLASMMDVSGILIYFSTGMLLLDLSVP
jgi:magnesium transporter